MRRLARWALTLLAAAVLAVPLAACAGDGGGDAGASAGAGARERLAGRYDLSGTRLTVGSKEFTEQLLLGQITRAALEAAGAHVDDQTGLEGSKVARRALLEGEIDMYWEYTGTGWLTHLRQATPIPNSRRQWRAVRDRDRRRHGVAWLEPAPFSNSYAIAASRRTARMLGVGTLSDLAELTRTDPAEATVCVGSEFANREDGLAGVQRRYGFRIPARKVSLVQDGVVYERVARSDPCNFGSVFSTDGRLVALGLTLLGDDHDFFAKFEPALTVRVDTLERIPDLRPLAAELADALDGTTMRSLNARVDVDGERPEDVAEDWLREEGFTG